MQELKRGLLFVLTFVSLISFVSAQFYRGYGRFSISNFFATLDPQTVTLVTLFVIFFALLFYALTKVFKTPTGEPNKGIAGVISLAVSFLMVYGMYRQGFDISNWFFRIGVPTDFFYAIMPFLLLAFAIILIWKTGIGVFLMIFGAIIFSIAAFTEIIYEQGIALLIGAILFFAGLFIRSRRARSALATTGQYGAEYGWEGAKHAGKGIGWAGKKSWGGARLARKSNRIQRRFQKAYDKEKVIYQNQALPYNMRNQAGKQMQRIAQRAVRKGINLNY